MSKLTLALPKGRLFGECTELLLEAGLIEKPLNPIILYMSVLTQNGSPVREIKYLRISLTDACNFRCSYCRGSEVYKPSKDLTREEITLMVKVFSKYGLKTVRFTGGEPLLRNDIVEIVSSVRNYVEDITLTTNGYFLKKFAKPLKEAGLKRLNVSLDSLDEKKFRSLTGGDLNKVLDGLREAKKYFKGIKINTVAIKGFTEELLKLLY
jgi:cyclic pyranopterin phosphate synthase